MRTSPWLIAGMLVSENGGNETMRAAEVFVRIHEAIDPASVEVPQDFGRLFENFGEGAVLLLCAFGGLAQNRVGRDVADLGSECCADGFRHRRALEAVEVDLHAGGVDLK